MKIPKIISKNGHEYIFVKEYPNFILYKDMITGVKETFQRYDLGLVKEKIKPSTILKKTRRIQMKLDREDLKDYKHNQEWIKGRLEYIEEYKTSITNITSVISDMPRGSKEIQDSMAEKVVTLLDNVEELLARIIKEQEKQKLILEQLDKVEQPYKLILEKEYIQGKSLVTVASEMNYTYEYIRKANGTALKKFEEVTKSY